MRKSNESAQLLLIAGFAIGVGIVVITVMLNNVIYASNMASESSIDTSRYDIANAIQTTTEAYQDAYRYAMEAGFNDTAYNEYISSYSRKASQDYATAGFLLQLQDHGLSDPYFTENGLVGGRDDWTLVSKVDTMDSFWITIPNTSSITNGSDPLVIKAMSNGSDLWSVKVDNSSGTVNITITDGSSVPRTYPLPAYTDLNITGNTPFQFNYSASTAGRDYSIRIYNGSTAVGMCTVSGNLSSVQPFTIMRHELAIPTLRMASSHMSINRTVPIILPGGIS